MNEIAVIIPVYEHIASLEKCLQSLGAQILRPAEIVVVDDGSRVEVGAAVAELCAAAGARYVRLEANAGAGAARNVGVRASTAELLFFCDADLAVEPDALANLARALDERPDAGFAYGDYVLWNGRLMRGQEFSAAALRDHNYISTMTLVRRAIFPGFDESLRRFQDWDLWLTLAERGVRGVYVSGVLFQCLEQGSMSEWLPAFVVRHPRLFGWLPRMRRYQAAFQRIAHKHSF